MSRPSVIGHRGASGHRPEHTLASYKLAIELGADFIEPDLVSTRDGVLVARHENEISGTTDVADRPEFAARKTEKTIDGVKLSGWFTEDFTLTELKTLRARERLPELRPNNTRYDGQFPIPTFDEIIRLAQVESRVRRRPIGLYPETKHPSYHASIGLPLEAALVRALHVHGYRGASAAVFIQSFETANLEQLKTMTRLPLVLLVDTDAAHLVTHASLRELARFVDGVGVNKNLIVPRDKSGKLLSPTSLVADAHAAGLQVHPWTFRSENNFLPADFQGDPTAEYHLFFDQGVDAVFSDFPGDAVAARKTWSAQGP
ncbi:MAG TPA: glycerophosphodiester phosphodiesterase [Polyangiales bacterium]|nr:glycerophosphodiester phosphodiesterase [Polyangiales bacterium]